MLFFRTRTTTESMYWKNTNNVRRNLLMAKVKKRIWAENEWNPGQENFLSNSDHELRTLKTISFRRLVAVVVSSVQIQVRDMSTDSTPFSDLPYREQPYASTFSSTSTQRLRLSLLGSGT